MSRVRSRSNKATNKDEKPSKKTRKQSDQTIVEITSPTIIKCHLLAYNFLLTLVTEYLNDGDVIARLLTLNKSITTILPKYSMKRLCDTGLALAVLDADPRIALSVTRVKASSTAEDRNNLMKVAAQINTLKEVHYYHNVMRAHDHQIPSFVTHLDAYLRGWSMPLSQMSPFSDSIVDLHLGLVTQEESIRLPSSVKKLSIILSAHHLANGKPIPDSVVDLTMTVQDFSRTCLLVPGMLPASLKRLNLQVGPFGVGVIPHSVIELELSNKLLRSLAPGTIPDSVKCVHISLNEYRNAKPIVSPTDGTPGILPDSVTQLYLESGDFNPQLMPTRLTHLILGYELLHLDITRFIPTTVTHLTAGISVKQVIPFSVTHLKLKSARLEDLEGMIPPSVTHLELPDDGCSYGQQLKPGAIPSSVTHIVFGCPDNQKMIPNIIPSSVTHLTFHNSFNRMLPKGVIPSSVKHVVFGDEFNRQICAQTFPHGLTHLCFGRDFNQPIRSKCIPSTVESLVFGTNFDQVIQPLAIPQSVKYLAFGSAFSHHLDEKCLPGALDYIEISRGYVKQDDECWLPSSLTYFSHQSKPVVQRPGFENTRWLMFQPSKLDSV